MFIILYYVSNTAHSPVSVASRLHSTRASTTSTRRDLWNFPGKIKSRFVRTVIYILYRIAEYEYAWTVAPVVALRRQDDDEGLSMAYSLILERFSVAAVNGICMIGEDSVSNEVFRFYIIITTSRLYLIPNSTGIICLNILW